MRRSSACGVPASSASPRTPLKARATVPFFCSCFLKAFCLATVPPRDNDAEKDMQPAEPGGHQVVGPGRGTEKRKRTEEHKAEAHDRNYPDGESAARHYPCTIEQQPDARNGRVQMRSIERNGQESTGEEWWGEAEHDFAPRRREERRFQRTRFTRHRPAGDNQRQQRLHEPDAEPRSHARL